jgi:putative membrane protein
MGMFVLAQMWDDGRHMRGETGWWWVMGIGWLVFLAAVVSLVVLFLRQRPAHGDGDRRSRPEELLAERFARGEIDEEEYRRRRAALRE